MTEWGAKRVVAGRLEARLPRCSSRRLKKMVRADVCVHVSCVLLTSWKMGWMVARTSCDAWETFYKHSKRIRGGNAQVKRCGKDGSRFDIKM